MMDEKWKVISVNCEADGFNWTEYTIMRNGIVVADEIKDKDIAYRMAGASAHLDENKRLRTRLEDTAKDIDNYLAGIASVDLNVTLLRLNATIDFWTTNG